MLKGNFTGLFFYAEEVKFKAVYTAVVNSKLIKFDRAVSTT